MNTELLWQATERLSETDDDVSILDDCARGNLYRSKVYELVSEKVRNDVAKQFFNSQVPRHRVQVFVPGHR
jgi:hypothetical protein